MTYSNAVRKARMEAARQKAEHGRADWIALVRAIKECHYCLVALNVFNGVQDHKVPVCRGGDDSIENLDYICWQCNTEKATRMSSEWSYSGPLPRPFKPSPRLASQYRRLVGA